MNVKNHNTILQCNSYYKQIEEIVELQSFWLM